MWVGCLAGMQPFDMHVLDALVDGALLGLLSLPVVVWPWRDAHRIRRFVLHLALILVGFAHSGHHVSRVSSGALHPGAPGASTLVRVRGSLEVRWLPVETPRHDLLDAWIQTPSDTPWTSRLDVRWIHDGDVWQVTRGTVIVTLMVTPPEMMIGTQIEVVGWLAPLESGVPESSRKPVSPCGCDRVIAILQTDSMPTRVAEPSSWRRVVHQLHDWLDSNLLTCLGFESPERNRALLVAMTTGRKLPGLRSPRDAFHRAGLSHFLAISGFNVAVLLVAARILMEMMGLPWRMRGWTLVTLALLFLIAVEPGVSVLRASLAGTCVGLALCLRRGWRPEAMLGVSATCMLSWRPCLATDLGFQLSFGAVLALLTGTEPVRHLLGLDHRGPLPFALHRRLQALGTMLAASVAAWLVSVPFTLHAVGVTHPWSPLTSALLGPCAALITITATLGTLTGWIPGSGLVLEPILDSLVACMDAGISTSAHLPGPSWRPGRMPAWWSLAGLVGLRLWWTGRAGRPSRGCVIMVAVGWLLLAMLLAQAERARTLLAVGHALRWTVIPLGDGFANVIQRGETATVVDAGSRSTTSTGSRLLVPALEALGVRSIDRVVIRGVSLDRCSAVPEVLGSFPVRQVMLSGDWFRAWPKDTPQCALLQALASSAVPIRDLDVIDGWIEDGWVWTCTRDTGARRSTRNAPLISVRHAGSASAPSLVLMRDCSESTIDVAMHRLRLHGTDAVEWPPRAHAHDAWPGILSALDARHVLQVKGDDTPACSLLRGRAGWRVWGILEQDGAMQYRVRDRSRPEELLRWSPSGWILVRRP